MRGFELQRRSRSSVYRTPWHAQCLLHCELTWLRRCWHDRQVSIEEGDAKARELNVNFIETSAKAGLNIKVRGEHRVHADVGSMGCACCQRLARQPGRGQHSGAPRLWPPGH